ncbi:hypothetical protein JOC75_000419 [Metabacillus crassostreae]|uniref:hypothetical protein n=1 Tax=Metabacillus crassostreae TaxID=929098 RepID=UPI00195CBC02|nr:hypothetical protein [Metabacillus crassostreae]MBM7602449.1 hypothetical protein [Metabacillus crassostreae]
MKFNARLNTVQIIFTSAFFATVVTIANSFIEWDNQNYSGIFAGITTIIGAAFAKVIFKEKNE